VLATDKGADHSFHLPGYNAAYLLVIAGHSGLPHYQRWSGYAGWSFQPGVKFDNLALQPGAHSIFLLAHTKSSPLSTRTLTAGNRRSASRAAFAP